MSLGNPMGECRQLIEGKKCAMNHMYVRVWVWVYECVYVLFFIEWPRNEQNRRPNIPEWWVHSKQFNSYRMKLIKWLWKITEEDDNGKKNV